MHREKNIVRKYLLMTTAQNIVQGDKKNLRLFYGTFDSMEWDWPNGTSAWK